MVGVALLPIAARDRRGTKLLLLLLLVRVCVRSRDAEADRGVGGVGGWLFCLARLALVGANKLGDKLSEEAEVLKATCNRGVLWP